MFTLSSEQIALRDSVRSLLSRHEAVERTGPQPVPRDLWEDMAELGALGLLCAEDVGGYDATGVELMVVAAELGRAGRVLPFVETVHAAVLLERIATEDERMRLLPGLVDGSSIVVVAHAEPMRTWSSPRTMSVSVGDAGWRLNGVKAPVPYLEDASHCLVTVGDGGRESVAVLDVSASAGSALVLADAPARQLHTPAAATDAGVDEAHDLATLVVISEALGAMDAALAQTTSYLSTRKQFGKPLAAFQTLSQRAADVYVSVELARSVVQYAAVAAFDDKRRRAETIGRARLVVSRAVRHVVAEVAQMHGGIGLTAEYGAGRLIARLTQLEHAIGGIEPHRRRLVSSWDAHPEVQVLT